MASSSERSLRIVMLLENCAYPQDVRVRHEAETLTAAGHRVSVLAPRAEGQPWQATVSGVHVYRFPDIKIGQGFVGYLFEFGYATTIMTLMVLWRWLRGGFDVLHLHNPPDTLFVAVLLPKLAGKHVVFDHHDLSAELYAAKQESPKPALTKVLNRLERYSVRLADTIITANDSYRTHDIEAHGVAPDRVWVVRNGPDLDRFPQPQSATRAAGDPVVIGYIGYIARQDGFDHLLYALNHLQYDLGCEAWSCLVIGPAEEPQMLERLVDELKLNGKITFAGRKPHAEALELLAGVDIGVAPEPYNDFNDRSTMIKVMEYMALAKPVVAYDLTEHRITAGDAALYAANSDPRELAQQIATLMNDPERRSQIGSRGRQRIEDHLSWTHSAQKLLDCYRAVAHQ